MIPNLVWTAVFLLPVAAFCYRLVDHKTVYILLVISTIPIFFPNSFFDAIQLSKRKTFYKRAGVKHINKFAQNGALLRKYLKRKYPGMKTVPLNGLSVRKQVSQTYFFEKFHFSLFILYSAVTVYALLKFYLIWALIISVCNLFYNIYPNLLQQYMRLRFLPVRKRS